MVVNISVFKRLIEKSKKSYNKGNMTLNEKIDINYLPSAILTKFIATSSEPVYCFPFTNRDGILKLSARTYIYYYGS